MSALADSWKEGKGLEVKQRRCIMIKVSWKTERNRRAKRGRESEQSLSSPPSLQGLLSHTPPEGTLMKFSILPLNSLWLYMERGLGFRIFCGLGGRVGGLGNDGQREQKHSHSVKLKN